MSDLILSPETPQFKRCTVCGELKPLTLFYHNRTRKDGLQDECKSCCAARKSAHRALHHEEIKRREREYNHANKEVRNAYSREHRATHQEEDRRARKLYNERTAQAQREYSRRYALEHKQERAEYSKEYRQKNQDARREYQRTYHRNNQEKWRISESNRRAAKSDKAGRYTAADIEAIRAAQGNRCYICHKKLTKYHVDHFIPLALGGTNDPGNLRLACPHCNQSKHAKHPHDMGILI